MFSFIPNRLVFDQPNETDSAYHVEEALKRLTPKFYWCAAAYIEDTNTYLFMYRIYYWIGGEIYKNSTSIQTFKHRSNVSTALLNFLDLWAGHDRSQINALNFESYDPKFEKNTLGHLLECIDNGIGHTHEIYQKAFDDIGYNNLLAEFWNAVDKSIEAFENIKYKKLMERQKERERLAQKVNAKVPNSKAPGVKEKNKNNKSNKNNK